MVCNGVNEITAEDAYNKIKDALAFIASVLNSAQVSLQVELEYARSEKRICGAFKQVYEISEAIEKLEQSQRLLSLLLAFEPHCGG